jgi:uncharacterized protein
MILLTTAMADPMRNKHADRHWEKLALPDRMVLFDPLRNRIVEIDDIALDVWDSLQTAMEQTDIIHLLSGKYPVDEIEAVIKDLNAITDTVGSPDPEGSPHAQEENRKKKISAWLQVSHDCNLRCDYCFAQHGTYGQKPRLMRWETAKKTADWLIAMAEESHCALHISFFGGEPLLNMAVIRKVVDYCHEKSPSIATTFSISSNGTILDEEMVCFIHHHGISLLISLDGSREVNDRHRFFPDGSSSFQSVMDNFERTLAHSGMENYEVSAAYGRDDPDLVERVKFFRKHGMKNINLDPLTIDPEGSCAFQKEDLPRLEEAFFNLARFYAHELRTGEVFRLNPLTGQLGLLSSGVLRKTRCFAGGSAFSIAADGGIYPCPQLASHEDNLMGSIDLGIDRAELSKWKDSENIENRADCPTCWARNMCGGGCRAESRVYNGSITAPYDTGCEIMRIIAKSAIWISCEMQGKLPAPQTGALQDG